MESNILHNSMPDLELSKLGELCTLTISLPTRTAAINQEEFLHIPSRNDLLPFLTHSFRSIVWKKELLTQVNSTTAILEVSMQTLDGNDLFPDKIPLQRSAVADWIYASDLWFLIGFSGNNDSGSNFLIGKWSHHKIVTDGISFQHNENSIISIESVQANAYNNYTLIDITGIQSQLQQEPLGYIVYFPSL